jgi:hypothetical protein
MTREEAIKWLNIELKEWENDCLSNHPVKEALRVAIEALEQEPRKGHWIETAEEYYKAINEKGGGVNENTDYFVDDIACSECLAKFSVIDNEAERFDFCPCCGSDNREVKNAKSRAKMEEVEE